MAEIASAYVSILPSARGFGTSLNRQVGPQVGKSGTAIGAGLGKSMLKGFIAIGAGIKIAQFLGDSLGEAREANAVAALTANVIKTTGGVAKVSAVQVNRLADALSRKTGIDDEQIASAGNLILTFKNVRREGEGLENIFNRATRASVDLSASGFGDTAGTAKMLGKALNDPIKGLTALGRAGVTFTEAQQDQIKGMVTAGNLLGAQKTILAEVESQVKGAAEAQVTNSDKARVALDNLKETIGQSLVPAVDAMAGLFANKIAPAITTFVTNLQSGSGSAGRFGTFIREQVLPVLQDLGNFIITRVIPAFREGLTAALNNARSAFDQVRLAIAQNRPEIDQILKVAKQLAVLFYTRVVPIFYKFASNTLPILGAVLGGVIRQVAGVIRTFNMYKDVIVAAVRGTLSFVNAAVDGFTRFATAVRQKIANVISTVKALPGKIKGFFTGLPTEMFKIGAQIVQGLKRGIDAAAHFVEAAVQAIINKIPEKIRKLMGIDSPSKVTTELGKYIGDGLAKGIADSADKVGQATEKLTKKVKEKVATLRDSLASVRSEFASLVEPIASNFTDGLFDFDTAGAFTANLTTVKGTLTTLLGNFKALIAKGLSPGFLYQLFQSGGPGLINSLAGLDAASVQAAGSLFGEVTSLSNQLGTAVAGATDKGAALEGQTVRLERKLDKLIKTTEKVGADVGDRVNGAASGGHRRGR